MTFADSLRERLQALSLEHEEKLNEVLVLQGRMLEVSQLLSALMSSNGRPVAEENGETAYTK